MLKTHVDVRTKFCISREIYVHTFCVVWHFRQLLIGQHLVVAPQVLAKPSGAGKNVQ